MVATSQPLAAMAGLRMMMDGGNAVDAAVAAAAALNVVEPASTGVGGDVFALVWMANERVVRALNASGTAPAQASISELRSRGFAAIPPESAYAVTVPGAVAGWQAILDRYGEMPMSEVLEPAVQYASDGFPVSEVVSSHWEAGVGKLLANPSGGELLLDGRAPRAGEVMRMPELAGTLQAIAEGGAEAFYRGPPADKIAGFLQQLGGWLSAADLAACEPAWEEPVSTDYRGVRCWQCPPNSQGSHVLMALNLLEGFDLKGMGFQSADTYHHLIESVKLAFADGLHHITDPGKMVIDPSELLSKDYAVQRRKHIRPDRVAEYVGTGLAASRGDTVYITCVDGRGNACSFINSVYSGFGTGLVVPGTGIVLHNRGSSFSLDPEHPNALESGKRPFHTLMPGMATIDGELWLSYGVMGAIQQAQGHLQVLANMIDFGLGPQEALDAPRFSVRPGQGVAIEDTVPEATIRELSARGHPLMVNPPHGVLFGGGQVIERDAGSGVLKGGSEPRSDGCAVGW